MLLFQKRGDRVARFELRKKANLSGRDAEYYFFLLNRKILSGWKIILRGYDLNNFYAQF